MSKVGVRNAILFLVFTYLCSGDLLAGISFNSQESKIKISSGARLNVGSTNLIISGTLSEDTGASITGNGFTFDNGLLEQANTQLSATNGTYDPLSNVWTFNGTSRLYGNGEILDLSGGGQIVIGSGTTLYLENITVTGLSDLAGKIVFTDGTSQLYLVNTTLSLSGNFSTLVGSIFVETETTIILGGYNWTINAPAVLTVNGSPLWLEVLSVEGATHGQLKVPKAIYDSNGYNSNNIAADISSGTLVLNNNAIIKETVTSQISNPNSDITNGNVVNNIIMNTTLILNSNQVVNMTNTAGSILDGNGQTIVFNNTSGPQFIIQDNVTVTLQNITLYNINQNTFNIKSGGGILIGPNTTFEFSENVTFSTGLFDVLNGSVFTLESVTGNKIVTFNDSAALNLGDNTLQLENIELGSITNISYGPANLIELNAEATVDVDVNNGLNFEAIGPENNLTLMFDNLTLSGIITYGDSAVNEFIIRFVLPNGLDPARVAAGEIHPIVNITGGPGIMLGGALNNDQRLTLENPYTILNLVNSNAFLFDQNGQIFFNELELRSNNVKQYSANVLIDGTRIIGQIIDPSFIRAFSPKQTQPKAKAYLEQKAAKDKITQTPKIQKPKETTTSKISAKPKIEPRIFKDKKSNILKNRKGIEDFNAILGIDPLQNIAIDNISIDDASSDFETLRAVVLPTTYDFVYEDIQLNMSVPPIGNLLLRSANMSNLFTDLNGVSTPFNIVLDDSSISMASQDVILAPDTQFINIVGTGNVIEVSNTLTINNNLLMDQNAELTISFNQSGNVMPTVIFSAGSSINIEYNSVLKFEGTGIVKLADGTIINLNGKKVTNSKTGETVSIQRAQLIISNGAILDFGKNVNINGIGKIILQDRGYIKPSAASSLIIGSNNNQADNDIDIEGIGNGGISLALPEGSTGQTSISLWDLTSNLNFSSGVLSVGNNGLFQINCSGSTLIPGNIKKFSFNGRGNLFIQEGGTLRMAPNKINNSTGWDYKLDWSGSEMSVTNNNGQNGIIDFVNFENKRYGSFTGIFNPSNIDLYKNYYKSNKTDISFSKLASMLVNQNSILLVSTLYNNPDGNQFVRTKYGISVQLNSDDVIDSDDENTGNIFGHNEQENFVILPDGTRQV